MLMDQMPFGFLQIEDAVHLRYGCWPHAGANHTGSVVILGGRTEFMEKYHETVTALHARGMDVFSLDWRGQGLSSRLLEDPTRGYICTYDQYVADLELFLGKVVQPNRRGPLMVLAHSMGANILVQYLKKHPGSVDKGVLISPMIDIRTAPLPNALVRMCCRAMMKLGKADQNIPSMRRNDAYRRSFAKNRLTHSQQRFDHIQQMLRDHPKLAINGVTYGWLSATFKAIDAIQRPGLARRITAPLLVVFAGDDRVVSNKAICAFAARLPRHQLICIAGAYHEILQEREGLQTQFWQAFDRFIQP